MKSLRSSAKNVFFSFLQHTNKSTQPPSWMDLFWIQSRLTPPDNCKAALHSRSPSRKPLQAHWTLTNHCHPTATGPQLRAPPCWDRPSAAQTTAARASRTLASAEEPQGSSPQKSSPLISGMTRASLSSSLINCRGGDNLHATGKGKRETAKMVPREITVMGFS